MAITSLNSLSFEGRKHTARSRQEQQKRDILHDTPLRYTGYCDDIGAAIRVLCKDSKSAFIKNLPVISYIPVGVYIGADVLSTYNKAKDTEGKKPAAKKALSTAIFQGITSLLLPIGIVAGAQKIAGKGFDKFIPALKQQYTKGGAKIANRKRDVALAISGVAGLIAVSKTADNFTKKVLMDRIINPLIGLDNRKND